MPSPNARGCFGAGPERQGPRRVARPGGARRAWGWDVWAVDSPLVSDVDDSGNVSYEGWFCV